VTKPSDVFVALALTLAFAAPASAAAVPPALGPEGLVFPFAGGGRAAPRDGLAATRARLALTNEGPLRDGGIVATPLRGAPFVIGVDGRIRMLPDPGSVADITDDADGALIALTNEEGQRILRLAPGATAWTEAATLPADFFALGLVALPEGYLIAGPDAVWRVEHGVRTVVEAPIRFAAVAVRPDGALAFASEVRDRIVVVAPGQAPQTLRNGSGPGGDTLGAFPDGSFLRGRTGGGFDVIGADGALAATSRLLHEPVRDGVPMDEATGVLLRGTVADGAAVIVDDEGERLRIAVGPGTQRPLAAITPDTYRLLASRHVSFVTTFAGLARVEVRRSGIVQTAAGGQVPAGPGGFDLPVGLPAALFSVRLQVTAPDGREAVARLHVDTRASLSLKRARKAARRLTDLRTGPCRSLGTRSARCAAIVGRRCEGTTLVTQRVDGPHARFRRGARACRVLRREHQS
jgi:hypothetical protein